jgi:hypothetical protein
VSVLAAWMITPPQALPAAMPMVMVMTANVQVNASVMLPAGTARCTEALNDPSAGDSGMPSGIIRTAITGRLGRWFTRRLVIVAMITRGPVSACALREA